MYHLKVVRENRVYVIQIGCVERMRNLTLAAIDYALDRDEFFSFEKTPFEANRSDEDVQFALGYIDEVMADYKAKAEAQNDFTR